MSQSMQKYQNLLNLCYVVRWSHVPMHRQQSVADHTFRVMAIGRAIASVLVDIGWFMDIDRFMLHAMDHDQEEAITGDHPGPEKDKLHEWPHPSTLCNWEILCKVADALECFDWWWVWGEKSWNNPSAPGRGDNNRDVRKIKWYTQNWPELLLATRRVMETIMGYDAVQVAAIFGAQEKKDGTTV